MSERDGAEHAEAILLEVVSLVWRSVWNVWSIIDGEDRRLDLIWLAGGFGARRSSGAGRWDVGIFHARVGGHGRSVILGESAPSEYSALCKCYHIRPDSLHLEFPVCAWSKDKRPTI